MMYRSMHSMVLLTYVCLAVAGVSCELPSEVHSGVPGTAKQTVSPAASTEVKIEPVAADSPPKVTLPDYSVYHTRYV